MKFYAGIDLGGTNIKCGIVDETGKILAYKKCKTPKSGAEDVISEMARLVKELSAEGGYAPEAAGVGCPGLIDGGNGMVVYSNNLVWKNVPLAEKLSALLSLPVRITNDANAAAYGEYFCGAGARYNSVIMVTIGTGVGSGIILDGKLYEGYRGAGAEVGHEVIRVGGVKCTCGRRGCLEAYASAIALIRETKEAMLKDKTSIMWEMCGGNIEHIGGKTAFEASRKGDKTAKRVVKNYINYLAEGIANVINAFRPEAILLGGGVCGEGDALILPLRKEAEKRIFGGTQYAPVDILKATLGNDAGIYGAAKLAMSERG